jgi:hypothetical protein
MIVIKKLRDPRKNFDIYSKGPVFKIYSNTKLLGYIEYYEDNFCRTKWNVIPFYSLPSYLGSKPEPLDGVKYFSEGIEMLVEEDSIADKLPENTLIDDICNDFTSLMRKDNQDLLHYHAFSDEWYEHLDKNPPSYFIGFPKFN